jgi:hypothetical protein
MSFHCNAISKVMAAAAPARCTCGSGTKRGGSGIDEIRMAGDDLVRNLCEEPGEHRDGNNRLSKTAAPKEINEVPGREQDEQCGIDAA